MKSKLSLFVFFMLFSVNSFAIAFIANGIAYSDTSATTVEVFGLESTAITVVTIPENVSYNGINYAVTGIAAGTFRGHWDLTSVTIPNSVTYIGNEAFNGCTKLTSVNIPNSVLTIGEAAFKYCTSLVSITIPNSISTINYEAFMDCSGLTSISLPNSITTIEGFSFKNCSSLTSIIFPNSVEVIGKEAFFNCISLTEVTIPNLVTIIDNSAFAYCTALTSINIPNSVTIIDYSAFAYCTALTSINIPNSVTILNDHFLRGCTSLNTITVNWTTPITITSWTFDDLIRPNITLNVFTSSAMLYEASQYWTDFIIATLGIKDFESKEIKLLIYPTPSSDNIKIQTDNKISDSFKYKILDLTGRIVKNGNSKFNEQISIESLTNGNYIIQIETESGEKLAEKLIKN